VKLISLLTAGALSDPSSDGSKIVYQTHSNLLLWYWSVSIQSVGLST
jgi:hypothetical protein